MRGIRGRHRPEQRELRVLERPGVVAGGCLHRGGGEQLHQVVDDHVAQRADGIVEVSAVLDPEPFGHRDLDRRDVVAVPDRLEHRVREPEVEELSEAHLPQEVVDPEQLRLVDVLVDLRGQLARGLEVVAERLLDDDSSGLGQARVGQPLDHPAEQERRDLEIEHRDLGVADRAGDALVRRGVAEVAAHVGHPRR